MTLIVDVLAGVRVATCICVGALSITQPILKLAFVYIAIPICLHSFAIKLAINNVTVVIEVIKEGYCDIACKEVTKTVFNYPC